jgi:mono/diheme cytochrome c family protein
MKDRLPNIRGALLPCVVLPLLAAAWLLLAQAGSMADLRPVAPAGRIVFNRDIRPILADRCFSCHGPDPNKRQAGLRLDRPDAATGPLPQHPNLRAFIPGDVAHSEAVRRILSDKPNVVMPPATSHLVLNAAEKDLIRRWVEQGGDYQEHWAFTKPVRPPLPAVADARWPRNDIDRFVLANLEANGLAPSPEADRPTLIRRVSLDLTGTPPTPAEVDAFVADKSPDAYEKVVDRLLASPRYGEQMAIPWLDAARYADSHGFQSDPERHMWRWRDWVINAYNADMPFDQFTIKQLAGDLLPNATADDKIATGFNRNNRYNDEGGIITEEWRVESVIDRASTTSAVFMGLTMECCRCHDHKYDPITQREFYSFTAYFNSVHESGASTNSREDKGINALPVLRMPTPEQQRRLDALTAAVAADEQAVAAAQAAATTRPTTRPAEPAGLLVRLPLDGSPLATGVRAVGHPATIDGPPDGPAGKATLFTPGVVIDAGDVARFDRTNAFSYGAWINHRGGGSPLSRMTAADGFRGFDLFVEGDRLAAHIIHAWPDDAIKVRATVPFPANAWHHAFATYDGSGKAAGVQLYIDGKAVATEVASDNLVESIVSKSPLLVGSRDGADAFDGAVADARVYGRALSAADVAAIANGPAVDRVLAIPAKDRTPEQAKRLVGMSGATDPALAAAQSALARDKRALAKLDITIPDTMVMEELPQPRDTFVLIRGEYDKHGDKVQPGTPAVLPPLPKDAPPNRLGLARWIVDPANPLTARVQANRLWEKFFGVGIVKTSENLGVQTDWPSNPELLDWLATEMVRLHWDLKGFQRELVLSAAYRQASAVTPELLERDPDNRLLARGPRFRLAAETIRDQALAVSGLLVDQVGGPSVRPYEPANLWAGNLYGNLKKYVVSTGDDLYRRSLYTFVKRTAAPPNLAMFDQPTREYCVIRRSRTDTPLQALDLMDDPTYVECARVLAEHAMATPDPIATMFKRATCRPPTADELRILTDGYQHELARFKAEPTAAAKLIAIGASKADPKTDVPTLAAYTTTASVILNLDEMVTKQ